MWASVWAGPGEGEAPVMPLPTRGRGAEKSALGGECISRRKVVFEGTYCDQGSEGGRGREGRGRGVGDA